MGTGGERATLGAGVERVAVLVAGGHGRRTAPVALARAVLRDSTGRPLSTNIIVRITPQAAGRVHSHLGDGGGEGDALRLTLALVRCHGPLPLHSHWFLYCYFCTPPPLKYPYLATGFKTRKCNLNAILRRLRSKIARTNQTERGTKGPTTRSTQKSREGL